MEVKHQKASSATNIQGNDEEHVNISKKSSKHDYRQPITKPDNSISFTKIANNKTAAVSSQIIATEVKFDSKNPDNYLKTNDEK